MDRLSLPLEAISDHSTVVVVGSGYGGAIAASRLARAGQRVTILERGQELHPGEYPDTQPELVAHAQASLADAHIGSRTALYDLRVHRDLDVVVGCGLGGGSLINAAVALRTPPRIFEDSVWPQALRDDLGTALEEGYRHSEQMLEPIPYPADIPPLAKLRALEDAAARLGHSFSRPPIAVSFRDGPNAAGVAQQACRLCGDCLSGCNYSAKNTLLMNYLPDAKRHGAEIFTRAEVRFLERKKGHWVVHYQALESGREAFDAPLLFITADVVVLAAGTLGSTEILLRSAAAGLPLSRRLGHRFTSNGDFQAFAYNCNGEANGVGCGHRQPRHYDAPPGPTITGMIDLRNPARLADGLAIHEGAVPGALAALLPQALAVTATASGGARYAGVADLVRKKGRELESLLRGAHTGAARHTLTFLVTTHDDAGGRLVFENDRARVHWPEVSRQPYFERAASYLKQITGELGGTYVKSPVWTGLTAHNLLTVGPLGGCVMAEDASAGVVNHKGQVFCAEAGAAVYEDLYVSDGSIIPRSLGVGPLLTISALAERAVALAAQDRGWKIDYTLPARAGSQAEPLTVISHETQAGDEPRSGDIMWPTAPAVGNERKSLVLENSPSGAAKAQPPGDNLCRPSGAGSLALHSYRTANAVGHIMSPVEAGCEDSKTTCAPSAGAQSRRGVESGQDARATGPLGIQFTETMRGYFSTRVIDDFERAAEQGRRDHSPFELTITVLAGDLDRLLSEPAHEARFAGSASAPALSAQALVATDGKLKLFVEDPDAVGARRACYRMRLTSEEGRTFLVEAFKLIRPGPVSRAWRDATTLYLAAYGGANPEATLAGRGVLTTTADDLRRELSTIGVTGAHSLVDRLQATARFGRFFAGALFDTYGGVFARATLFNPGAAPRKKRPLRAPAPEIHDCKTRDGVRLRLTRYRGGAKGPVLVTHGLGVSSLIFAIDTIETNLTEYLVAHGFDVWLLDYRASIELAASAWPFTADDIAAYDYPAAVTTVRELSGARDVQALVHCFGATTFFMSMLAGLAGVRSIVCSQVATHLVTPFLTRFKCGLHVPDFLEALGVESLTAYVDSHAGWQDQLYDEALRVYPLEADDRCRNPVCHRISFLYSLLYEHGQLNAATHEALHEMFGLANTRAFEHLGLMVREGHVVGARGENEYLPHLERLAVPIDFIHGGENECFLPESTAITYTLLRERNGKNLYSRHVIAGYGHIDCIFGKNAARDVYPHMVRHLEAT